MRAADGSKAGDTSGLASLYNVNWRRNNQVPIVPGMMGGPTKPNYHSISDFESFPGSERCNETGFDCLVSDYVSGAPRDLNEAVYNRYQTSAIVSYLANFLGHHVIKAGFEGEFTGFSNTKSNRVFVESEDGSQFDDEERFGYLTGPDMVSFIDPLIKKTSSLTVGGFLQDSWSVMDKVTVNLGIRYDSQYFYNTAGNVGLSLPNQWSPRLGLIYDPTQSGKAKMYVNYARYYENAPLGFADVVLVASRRCAAATSATRSSSASSERSVRKRPTCGPTASRRPGPRTGSSPPAVWPARWIPTSRPRRPTSCRAARNTRCSRTRGWGSHSTAAGSTSGSRTSARWSV
jgi:hypothetical protein